MSKDDDPPDLPEVNGLPPPAEEINDNPVDKARFCQKCGKEGRVVSNFAGVNVFCDPCGIFWAVSASRVSLASAPYWGPRGLTKETAVEPDYSLALDTSDQERMNANPTRKFKK